MDLFSFLRKTGLPDTELDLDNDRTVPRSTRKTSSVAVLILLLIGGACVVMLATVLFG